MKRRAFIASAAATAGAVITGANVAQADPKTPFNIGMLMFNDMTYLDFSGPNDLWSRPRNAKISVISKSMDVVRTDTGTKVLPDMLLSQAPDLDLIFVGGGPGVSALMEDAEILDFLEKRAPSARFITSVCTGALVLGAAGLLRGRKATTHWTAMDVLPIFGAKPVSQRVVTDGNLITGGGVTAGIDFGLSVAAQVWGEQTAQLLQLGSEYDPHPPFNAGRPETAPPEVVSRMKAITKHQTSERIAIAERAAARFR